MSEKPGQKKIEDESSVQHLPEQGGYSGREDSFSELPDTSFEGAIPSQEPVELQYEEHIPSDAALKVKEGAVLVEVTEFRSQGVMRFDTQRLEVVDSTGASLSETIKHSSDEVKAKYAASIHAFIEGQASIFVDSTNEGDQKITYITKQRVLYNGDIVSQTWRVEEPLSPSPSISRTEADDIHRFEESIEESGQTSLEQDAPQDFLFSWFTAPDMVREASTESVIPIVRADGQPGSTLKDTEGMVVAVQAEQSPHVSLLTQQESPSFSFSEKTSVEAPIANEPTPLYTEARFVSAAPFSEALSSSAEYGEPAKSQEFESGISVMQEEPGALHDVANEGAAVEQSILLREDTVDLGVTKEQPVSEQVQRPVEQTVSYIENDGIHAMSFSESYARERREGAVTAEPNEISSREYHETTDGTEYRYSIKEYSTQPEEIPFSSPALVSREQWATPESLVFHEEPEQIEDVFQEASGIQLVSLAETGVVAKEDPLQKEQEIYGIPSFEGSEGEKKLEEAGIVLVIKETSMSPVKEQVFFEVSVVPEDSFSFFEEGSLQPTMIQKNEDVRVEKEEIGITLVEQPADTIEKTEKATVMMPHESVQRSETVVHLTEKIVFEGIQLLDSTAKEKDGVSKEREAMRTDALGGSKKEYDVASSQKERTMEQSAKHEKRIEQPKGEQVVHVIEREASVERSTLVREPGEEVEKRFQHAADKKVVKDVSSAEIIQGVFNTSRHPGPEDVEAPVVRIIPRLRTPAPVALAA